MTIRGFRIQKKKKRLTEWPNLPVPADIHIVVDLCHKLLPSRLRNHDPVDQHGLRENDIVLCLRDGLRARGPTGPGRGVDADVLKGRVEPGVAGQLGHERQPRGRLGPHELVEHVPDGRDDLRRVLDGPRRVEVANLAHGQHRHVALEPGRGGGEHGCRLPGQGDAVPGGGVGEERRPRLRGVVVAEVVAV